MMALWSLLVLGFSQGGLPVTWADDSSSEAWPEQVYFPQRADQEEPPAASALKQGRPATPTDGQYADGSPGVTPEPKKHWHFKKRNKSAEAPNSKDQEEFHAVPPKPSAQKADPPASPYPLLRLPMPIITDQGIIPPGIYLIKTEVNDPIIGSMTAVYKAPKAVINGEKPLLLTRQNQVMARIPIHAATLPDENVEQTGTTSPITAINPKLPPSLKVRAELSADQRRLHLVVTHGSQHYESDEYTVGTDLRHKLTF